MLSPLLITNSQCCSTNRLHLFLFVYKTRNFGKTILFDEQFIIHKMSIRFCVYKDCHNFHYRQDKSASNDFTLFAFPKDRERAELWHLLGQVDPKIQGKHLFMCSKHFDSKYLSTSKYRTILVGEAVPIPYGSQEDKTITNTQENEEEQEQHEEREKEGVKERLQKEKEEHEQKREQEKKSEKQVVAVPSSSSPTFCINSSVEDAASADNEQPAPSSTVTNQQSFYINLIEDDQLEWDTVAMVESTTQSNSAAEKEAQNEEVTLENNEIEVSIVPPSRKRARATSASSPRIVELQVDETSPFEDEQLIDANEVSIFRIKGEQYVQMSRDYYLQEKRQLIEQLHTYKHILKKIRRQLAPLEDL